MNRPIYEPTDRSWYVQAEGRVWGPYAETRLAAFVAEGRVGATSLLADDVAGPFAAAVTQPALRPLFTPVEAEVQSQAPASTSAARPAPQQAGEARPLLVFAGFRDGDAATFEAALANHGPYERVSRGVWLVRARMGAAGFRNVLSRRFRAGDTLLVVEAGLEQAAWFNLDQAEERRLRALWIR
jgi:hypothetical protein